MTTIQLLDCGHAPTETESPFTNGIAHFEGKTMCYECAADLDREEIRQGRQVFAYVSSDGRTVTTWAGSELMRITYHGTGPGFYGYPMHYYRAVTPEGQHYYGKNGGYGGGAGCAIRLRPSKS